MLSGYGPPEDTPNRISDPSLTPLKKDQINDYPSSIWRDRRIRLTHKAIGEPMSIFLDRFTQSAHFVSQINENATQKKAAKIKQMHFATRKRDRLGKTEHGATQLYGLHPKNQKIPQNPPIR